MKTVTVVCDTCGKDISYHESSYPVEWSISVKSHARPRPPGYTGGITFATVPEPPPIRAELTFCRLTCLKEHFA